MTNRTPKRTQTEAHDDFAPQDERETTASRRLHPRFSVDIQVAVSADSENVSARTRDISRSGVCLVATQALAREKEIGLELVLTFSQGGLSEPLHLRGRVVWCTAIFGHYQIGVKFIEADREQTRNLDMFLGFLDGSLNAGELFGSDEETTDNSSDDPDDPFGS